MHLAKRLVGIGGAWSGVGCLGRARLLSVENLDGSRPGTTTDHPHHSFVLNWNGI